MLNKVLIITHGLFGIEHVLSEETFDKLKQHAKAYIDAQGK